MKKDDVKCPWCNESLHVSELRVVRRKSDWADIIERDCGRCGRVLSAYLESEKSFLPKIRTF